MHKSKSYSCPKEICADMCSCIHCKTCDIKVPDQDINVSDSFCFVYKSNWKTVECATRRRRSKVLHDIMAMYIARFRMYIGVSKHGMDVN
jgi:hypothetical protein